DDEGEERPNEVGVVGRLVAQVVDDRGAKLLQIASGAAASAGSRRQFPAAADGAVEDAAAAVAGARPAAVTARPAAQDAQQDAQQVRQEQQHEPQQGHLPPPVVSLKKLSG